jgi:hypothetical protein
MYPGRRPVICLVDCTESLDCPHTCKRVSFSKLNIVVRTLSVGTCSERSYRLPAHLQSFCATVLFRRSEFTVADRNMYLIYSSNTAFGWSKVTGTHQMCTVHRHGGAVRKNAIGHNHLHARCLRGDTVCADFAPDRWTHFPVRLTRCINNLPLLQGGVFVDRHAFLPDAHGRSNREGAGAGRGGQMSPESPGVGDPAFRGSRLHSAHIHIRCNR